MTRVAFVADGSGAILHQLAASQGKRRAGAAWTMTLLIHGGFAALALGREPTVEARTRVTEIEMLPLPPPPPEPEPPPPAPSDAVASAALPSAKPRAARPKAAAPASAAPLRTVEETAPSSDEPVRFVTDPNGSGFGFGTVARGGTAPDHGSEAPSAPVQGPNVEAPALSRPPRLAEADPCRGYFPDRARVDRGEVTLRVRVERDGSVQWVTIVREQPTGQGFSFAARDCLRAKRFSPALDRAGREVAVVSPVTVRFTR